ncbi:glycosyltransferase [Psychrobacter sanguinis]|uniref:glycosyltransferase n=1 Tax=Psychrobacter sanguinis TaxID=861445 RepID=UPI00020C7A1C|nr:glycosyltransferase [Psychrobacter sanguinis]EGK13966.1 glycosyl transferase [Psychrobacter sp. 1501(2011)]MCD9150534.1 glycosyltransferase [Psychrobacter sanguinis]
MYLSIIIPFYNSQKKLNSIFNTLSLLDCTDLEVIFVDDGSTDKTYDKLVSFRNSHVKANITIFRQDNKGPGGARNTGLKNAKGDYVWFVDSDDDITKEAINYIKLKSIDNYDVINFNYLRKGIVHSGIDLEANSYTDEAQVRKIFLEGFGPLWSNVYKREMLIKNNIYYPEYCYYEDNPLAFIYPFFVKSLLKSDIVAYKYIEDNESIVRTKPNLRTLDRLYTAEYGLRQGLEHTINESEVDSLKEKFIKLYLINSVRIYLTKKPTKQWLTAWRIMKSYRMKAEKLSIEYDIPRILEISDFDVKYKYFFYFHWLASHTLLSDQDKYFERIRKKAWNM